MFNTKKGSSERQDEMPPRSNGLVAKLAENFMDSAAPYKAINTVLTNLEQHVGEKTPDARSEVAPGVWVDFENGRGVQTAISAGPDNSGLRINTTDRGDSPWFSFSYALPIDPVKESRFLGVILDVESAGLVAFRPCLRYLYKSGFADRFFHETIVIQGKREDQIDFIKVEQSLAEEATGCEILFFFNDRKFDLTLHAIENLAIR